MSEYTGPIIEKYLKIDAGLQRLRSGEFKPFTGFPQSLENRYNLSMLLSPNSVDEYETRIGEPIRQIEEATGVQMIMAGRNFPLHVTLQEGQLPQNLLDERDGLFQGLNEDIDLSHLRQQLSNKDMNNWFMGKYVLSDGASLLLTAPHIPHVILSARGQISDIYADAGLEPLPMDNILHSTLARITGVPETDREDALEECYSRVMEIKRNVSTQPLVLSVEDIYQGPAYNLVTAS